MLVVVVFWKLLRNLSHSIDSSLNSFNIVSNINLCLHGDSVVCISIRGLFVCLLIALRFFYRCVAFVKLVYKEIQKPMSVIILFFLSNLKDGYYSLSLPPQTVAVHGTALAFTFVVWDFFFKF